MRAKILIFIALVIFTSCNDEGSDNSERSLSKIKKKAISITEDYAKTTLQNKEKKVSRELFLVHRFSLRNNT